VQLSVSKMSVELIPEEGEVMKEPGTGFMISNDLLMTNHHVIQNTPFIQHREKEKNYRYQDL